MNAAINRLYDYHFALNQRLWDECVMALSEAQFTQPVPYSLGSVHAHCLHLIGVEWRWFARIQGAAQLPSAPTATDRAEIRRVWDGSIAYMREYLDVLDEEELSRVAHYDIPHRGGERHDPVWLILVHVVNHATDHRAQMLRVLHDLGAPTFEQDLMIYHWANP